MLIHMNGNHISRRDTLKILGTGSLGVLAGRAFSIPRKQKYLITLSFDDGFEKSSIKTAEIYEKDGSQLPPEKFY